MRLLVYDIEGKIFVKARHFKKLSASRVKIIARGKLQNLQFLLSVQNKQRPMTAINFL